MKRVTRQDVFNTLITDFTKQVFTCIPGHFVAFTDQDNQRAQVQIGIQRVDVYGSTFNPPPNADVPVIFPGGKWTIEHQLDSGDEGLIFFSQRCIDGWKQTGGVANNPAARFHHPQDAFFLPGGRSLATAMKAFQNNGVRLRNADGTQFVWLKNDSSIVAQNPKASVTLGADGTVNVRNNSGYVTIGEDGTVTINGLKIDKNGNLVMTSGTTIIDGNGITVESHRHNGVEQGNDISGGPVA